MPASVDSASRKCGRHTGTSTVPADMGFTACYCVDSAADAAEGGVVVVVVVGGGGEHSQRRVLYEERADGQVEACRFVPRFDARERRKQFETALGAGRGRGRRRKFQTRLWRHRSRARHSTAPGGARRPLTRLPDS